MNDEKYEIFVVSDEKSLKFYQSDKPILLIQEGNYLIKVASFKDQQSANLFLRALHKTYEKVER